MLPYDFQDLKEYHDNRQAGKAQTFIVKPEANCQGRGIFLTRNIDSKFSIIKDLRDRNVLFKDIYINLSSLMD